MLNPLTTVSRERPIIFSGESVRAIIAGHKTQTRRVVKPQPEAFPAEDGRTYWAGKLRDGSLQDVENDALRRFRQTCPYGRVGDRLWLKHPVRVTGRSVNGFTVRDEGFDDRERSFRWEDFPHKVPAEGKRFGRGFPRMLSRLTIEITGVWVERLQAIDEADAIAEGCQSHYCSPEDTASCEPGPIRELAKLLEGGFLTAKNDFYSRWDALNAARGFPWSSNPWVWVVSFGVAKGGAV